MEYEDTEQQLACKVIACAVWDWCRAYPPRPKSENPETLYNWELSKRHVDEWRLDAERFLFGGDLAVWAEYGGLDSSALLRTIESEGRDGCRALAPRHFPMPRYFPQDLIDKTNPQVRIPVEEENPSSLGV